MMSPKLTGLLISILWIISISIGSAQIGGISSIKVNAITHLPLAMGTAEFEPNYTFTRTTSFWDDDGELIPLFPNQDSANIETLVSFRMAYPISKKIEIGTFIASDFSNWSVKYTLLDQDRLGLATMGGINLPYGVTTVSTGTQSADNTIPYAYGLIGTYKISEKSSIDVNVQRQSYLSRGPQVPFAEYFFTADFGHYVGDQGIQLVHSVVGYVGQFDQSTWRSLTYFPGIVLEMKSNYAVTINGFFDLTGKNIGKTSGFNVAWTILL
jgi:hypothetical protein